MLYHYVREPLTAEEADRLGPAARRLDHLLASQPGATGTK
jgi:hypothetical protein